MIIEITLAESCLSRTTSGFPPQNTSPGNPERQSGNVNYFWVSQVQIFVSGSTVIVTTVVISFPDRQYRARAIPRIHL